MHGHGREFGCLRCVELERGAEAAERAHKAFALPGAPTQWSRDREFDVEHIRIALRVQPEQKRIAGEVRHTIKPFRDGLRSVELDCRELSVKSVRAMGKRCSFDLADGKLLVTLPAALPRGKRVELVVEYAGTPRRGMYFTGPTSREPERQLMVWTQGQDEDSRFWFPCFDFPNEKQTTEVIATIPQGMKALSNGRLVSRRKHPKDKTETWHYKLEVPHVSYLVTLCVGDFDVFESKWRGVPVTFWSPKGRLRDAKRTLARTQKMLTLFSEKTGVRYPYPQYAQIFVHDFIFGGMENTSATTLMDTAIIDAHAEPEMWMDALIAHELGHQWFGDMVTCRDWSHGWLNEGFATFLEAVWKGALSGPDEEAYYRLGEQGEYLDEDRGSYRRPIVCRTFADPIEIFDRHLYQKGGCVLHMLQEELGEPSFWAAIRLYLERHAWGSVVTDDLRRAIEDVTGRNLEWFFDQWVLHGGHPDLEVSMSTERGQAILKLRQRQKVDAMTPLFRFKVTVRIHTQKGVVTRELEVRDAVHNFVIDVPGKVEWFAFDPGAHLLFSGKVTQSDEANARCLSLDPCGVTRVRAARALAGAATPAALEALAAALKSDGAWFVRVEAARGLGEIKGDKALSVLLAHARDQDPRVRSAVAHALGGFLRDARASEALIDMLRVGEKAPLTLFAIGAALGRTKVASAFDVLVQLLGRPSWNDMAQRGALTGLGALGDERATPLLLRALGPDHSDASRAAAAAALRKVAPAHSADAPRVREELEAVLQRGPLRAQLAAIGALRERREHRSITTLSDQAARDLDGRVRRQSKLAASAIAQGLDRGEELRKLRDELESVKDELTKLRGRIDKVEDGKRKG